VRGAYRDSGVASIHVNLCGIHERTIKFHIGNIFDKLGVHNRNAAAEIAGSQNTLNTKPPAA
jgi:hypothetical protein